jgi:hypothetical protein
MMRRPVPAFAAALVVIALLVSACGDDDGDSGGNTTTAQAAAEPPSEEPRSPVVQQLSNATADSATSEDVYEGTLRISVAYYGYDCQLRDLDLHRQGERTYRMPVEVVRGAAAQAEGVSESSPFNLVVSANPGNEAGITTVSATVATDPNGNLTLFEYWSMNVQGSHVQGELVNSWRRAGLAANVFPTDRLVVPCRPDLGVIPKSIQTINEGAQMRGTITDEQVELEIRGETFDKERRFVAEVTATRQ